MWIEQNVESLHVSAFRNVLFQQLPTKLVLRNSLLLLVVVRVAPSSSDGASTWSRPIGDLRASASATRIPTRTLHGSGSPPRMPAHRPANRGLGAARAGAAAALAF